ncbi:MAG: aminopeptidase P family protein [Elusimicrobia bacterium]|nr:aminopeptidase P family protein [Elusimicrobiota bacterium]
MKSATQSLPYPALRRAIARRLPDGLILLCGGERVARNADTEYDFRQKSDFLYLCGVDEPDCHLLIDPRRGRQTLFMPRIDNEHRVWLGHVPGPAEAKRLYGVPRVAYCDALPKELKRARQGYRKVYADQAALRAHRPVLRGLQPAPGELAEALRELRACKTPGEIALIEKASAATARAHRAVMAAARPGWFEYEAQALFEAECRRAGLPLLAFQTIAASGANSAVLHYHRNDRRMRAGELLLLDSGAECRGYAADITRTFPVSGRFTARQKDVYSIVLQAQKECIAMARPGLVSAELHRHSMRVIAEGLKSLRILRGDADGLVENGAVRLFYPHGLSHMMGLDVHDSPGGKKRMLRNPFKFMLRFVAKLEPGFVVTVEPGLYFIPALINDPRNRRKHRASVDFRRAEGFLDFGGVRIEDDIVITAGGPARDLTDVPKEIRDVEAACGR